MKSKYNRKLTGCWDEDKIRKALDARIAELKSTDKKSASRIHLLRTKISKLKRALEGKASVGGQISPKVKTKVVKTKTSSKRRDKKVCFKCRKRGHTLKECKESDPKVCFRCGSQTHTLSYCNHPDTGSLPFSTCFVCSARGHISSQCPENSKGVYPNGGACFYCGAVDHLKAHCPQRRKNPEPNNDTKSITTST